MPIQPSARAPFRRPLALVLLSITAPSAIARQASASAEDDRLSAAELQSATIELIREGDYADARKLIDALLLHQYLTQATTLLDAEAPADALLFVDRLLLVEPRHTAGRLLKADGSLMLAEQGISNRASAALIEGSLQDALEFYALAADESPRAALGASRAARMLGDTQASLRWARTARALIASGELEFASSGPSARRTVSEAVFRAYTEAKSLEAAAVAEADAARMAAAGEANAEAGETGETSAAAADVSIDASLVEAVELARTDSRALLAEAEDALALLLGRESDDAWVWSRLSDLYEWEGRFDRSLALVRNGLARLPDDSGLISRLARVGREESGRDRVVELFDEFTLRNPNNALGHWYLGFERFERALDGMLRDGKREYARDAFFVAEASFRRSRELNPDNARACYGYEVMCRNARGWCSFNLGRLEQALGDFQSMNELFDRGVEWALEGRLLSGVYGIAFVGDQYNVERNNVAAAEAFELAHKLELDNSDWANNAGFFLRDAAVELELDGRRLCRAANGRITDAETLDELRILARVDSADAGSKTERARFRDVSAELMTRAREMMERSWQAYRVAAELSSDDVRTVNDAGLVLVYYTHDRLDIAESLLLKSANMGIEQVAALKAEIAAEGLSEGERLELEGQLWELENAWGDAYQNLGVLEWVHRRNAEKALQYLERSAEIGPDPRPLVSNNLIPLLRGERELGDVEYFVELGEWGGECK